MPVYVDPDRQTLLPASKVLWPTPVVRTVTPTVDTNALAPNDLAVTLLTPLYGVATAPGKTTTLQQLNVVDASLQSVTIELWFFDTISITLPALNAAWSISDAHAAHCVGVVQALNSNYYASALNSISINKQLGLSLVAGSGPQPDGSGTGSLWFATIVRGAATYGAATDVQFTFTFYPDA